MLDTIITKYPFVIVTTVTRKPGLTREQFRHHLETAYAPLVKKVTGNLHPLTWTRRYHIDDGEGPKGLPRVLVGVDDNLADCFSEMTFVDELHCQQFLAFMHTKDAEPLLEEEAKFADMEKMKIIIMRREYSFREEIQKA
ncbi:hypothetical protein BU23DRAFT_595288 [Bimuria novae-zelandiae CBS 107.79]|uniref:EthD domain-containing protein n=1 Tax=Bimuria novae-zelandiae CBS 107.79 TaxID=1447943 RepID=A0A6A5VX12_9PLEO|nr:hypothetical protein BU23DRAFT_595288 [Bimuria novae-zelandiae CBS 107.79]